MPSNYEQHRMSILNSIYETADITLIADALLRNCPDDEGDSPLPPQLYGNARQIEVIQYIRLTIENDSFDFVESTDERVDNAGLGPALFNMLVAMYVRWSRLWKRKNPEPLPVYSRAPVFSSEPSARATSWHEDARMSHLLRKLQRVNGHLEAPTKLGAVEF
jgi:hypothetical protein